MSDKHIIRVTISPGYITLKTQCHSSDTAECKIEGGDGNGSIVCRYIQWWKESEIGIEEFYAGKEEVLNDGTEIEIFWGDDAWEWELKK